MKNAIITSVLEQGSKKSFMDIYKQWVKAGRMTDVDGQEVSGLCDLFGSGKAGESQLFELMRPTDFDLHQLREEGQNTCCWASGSSDFEWHKFTELRQTIILFLAAMNNEL